MLSTEKHALAYAIKKNMREVELQIENVDLEASERGIRSCDMKSPDGQSLLTPLLLAKANLLLAYIQLSS